jgi:RNA polymerase sigma-70 factor (ECF subfamily)
VRALADLESIYRQNADTVFRFLMSRTGSVDLSEELTQETFYQAVKSIDRYDGNTRITSWLCGIAQNVLYAHLRSRRKDPLPLEEAPEQSVASTEEIVVRKDEAEAILQAIEAYPDPGGEVLRLRICGGLSFKQIGAILGHTETWARVNYYRAKQAIVKELNRDDE